MERAHKKVRGKNTYFTESHTCICNGSDPPRQTSTNHGKESLPCWDRCAPKLHVGDGWSALVWLWIVMICFRTLVFAALQEVMTSCSDLPCCYVLISLLCVDMAYVAIEATWEWQQEANYIPLTKIGNQKTQHLTAMRSVLPCAAGQVRRWLLLRQLSSLSLAEAVVTRLLIRFLVGIIARSTVLQWEKRLENHCRDFG